MNPELKQRIAVRASGGIKMGAIYSARPWYPSRLERADLVAGHTPPWAIASAHTAGWVWSGMGRPEPWSLLRPVSPEISPLERTHWRARRLSEARHGVVALGQLRLLDSSCVVREILLGEGEIDACASQLAFLTDLPSAVLLGLARGGRTRSGQRDHAVRVVERLTYLRERYPDITR